MSTFPPPDDADTAGRAAGWAWLSSLPRPATAHAERGPDPLGPTTALLRALGDPQRHLRVIHVVGSKGKGSTVLFTESLLRRLGRRTLAFTSPHLERWTERLRLDGAEVDGATGLAATEAVREAAATTGIHPGFFEALTVAACWLAAERSVDWCILEAGVGGRADATNVVRPQLVVLTSIEREHVDRLGDTVAAIAREKAGAIKAGAPVVAPLLPPPAMRVVETAVQRCATRLVRVLPAGHPGAGPGDIHWRRDRAHLELTIAANRLRVPFGVPGAAMAGNAALAIAAVQCLGLASREALRRVARDLGDGGLPGRFETLSTLPWIVIDGAHTQASAEALAAGVREMAPARVTLLLSLSANRDLEAVATPLVALATRVIVTRADATYSLAPRPVADRLRTRWPTLSVEAVDAPEDALGRACQEAGSTHLVLATGSVYLAGRVRALMRA